MYIHQDFNIYFLWFCMCWIFFFLLFDYFFLWAVLLLYQKKKKRWKIFLMKTEQGSVLRMELPQSPGLRCCAWEAERVPLHPRAGPPSAHDAPSRSESPCVGSQGAGVGNERIRWLFTDPLPSTQVFPSACGVPSLDENFSQVKKYLI